MQTNINDYFFFFFFLQPQLIIAKFKLYLFINLLIT